jgi:proteasome lid subunit RPN8/RPN11
MMRHSLRCSFCRRHEDEVAKLVAGPRVYICDRCVAVATEMMNAPVDANRPTAGRSRSLRARIAGWRSRPGTPRTSRRTSEVLSW